MAWVKVKAHTRKSPKRRKRATKRYHRRATPGLKAHRRKRRRKKRR